MGESPLEKVKAETRLLEKIMLEIPGFRGYKEKELRREADRLLRNHLYRKLTEAKGYLKEVYQKLVDNRITEVWTDMDRLIARFDKVSEEINHAAYGYSGFYDAVKVEEENLDAMITFDSKLVDNVRDIDTKVQNFKEEVVNGQFGNARIHIREIRTAIEHLESLFTERRDVILGVKVG